MACRKVRVFLGNLPPDILEEDVKRKLKKYAACNDVELKHRHDGSTFAFANLEDTPDNIDKCFEQVSAKQWGEYQVTVQLAKESFLQRLQKEREAEKADRADNEVYNDSENTKHEVMQRFETFSNVWKDDPSAEKITKKDFFNSKYQLQNNNSFNKVRKNNTSAEKLTKKDSFNSKNQHQNNNSFPPHTKKETKFVGIGRDTREPLCSASQNSDRLGKRKREDGSSSFDRTVNGIDEGVKKREVFDNFKEKSDNKRLKSIEERYKNYVQKKQVVKSALSKINDSNRSNKKIIFDEDEYGDDGQEAYQNISVEKEKPRENRPLLFDEGDEADPEENRFEDFRIRNHFEGRKGQKLFELQARYGNDSRFRLDERFYESDEERTDKTVETPKKETQTEEEKYTMLQVLKNILGDEAVSSRKAKTKPTAAAAGGTMRRFDPTNPDNSTLEIKPEGMKKKKKKKLANIDVDETKESVNVKDQMNSNVNDTLPIVSKERYYQVSDSLKEVFERKEKFSFLEMFKEDEEEEKEEEAEAKNDHEAQPIQQKLKWNLDPFKYDSSDEEEEEKKEEESLVERGPAVKRETFFFSLGDDRFKEGVEFIRSTKKHEERDSKKIQQIKNLVKHKVKLRQRDNFVPRFRRRRK